MENLDEVDWDVVIVGTGLQEALLALALSRCDKKILHLDRNEYYGGDAAALSLEDAEAWAAKAGPDQDITRMSTVPSPRAPSQLTLTSEMYPLFTNASIQKSPSLATQDVDAGDENAPKLGPSRKYSLALAPQLVYARSSLISTLVSAKVDSQLEFLAMGNWFLCPSDDTDVVKVPTGREDLFADQTIDAKSKRSLIKFLRFVSTFEEEEETWRGQASSSFAQFLEKQFNLRPRIQQPLGALAMSQALQTEVPTEFSLRRIARHFRSTGHLGPNFGAVISKYGGLAEITQVACRACAVGGATYVLGEGIEHQEVVVADLPDMTRIHMTLSSGQSIKARRAVYGRGNAVHSLKQGETSDMVSKLIAVVSSPLSKLFPPLGEDAPKPAGAAVRVSLADEAPPITIIVHSGDTGDCPAGQSVCYVSSLGPLVEKSQLLERAIGLLLAKTDPSARVLWRLQYDQRCADERNTGDIETHDNGLTVSFPPLSSDLVFDDTVLDRVKAAWQLILGPEAEDFMQFERRGGEEDE